jgi:hypothetical protein
MTRLAAGGIFVVAVAEGLAVVFSAQRYAVAIGGLAAALFVLAACLQLDSARRGSSPEPSSDDATELLQRWRNQTQATVHWAESTRGDWDRYLRPKLAREFLLAVRQKDPASRQATGRLVFGDELWTWVDPSAIRPERSAEPGPGYTALAEILRRMERI